MITLEPPRRLPGVTTRADPWAALGLSRQALARFLTRARAEVGLCGGVDVLLGTDATLRRLNRDFRGKDRATDVLSFPTAAHMPGGRSGDLAISLRAAARQARRFQHSLSAELRILMLHGLLHLAGMDHETDEGDMAAREAQLRAEFKLPSNLIERTGAEPRRKRQSSKAVPR